MSETKVIDLSQVKLDDMNFNRHNADGMKLLEKSISSNRFGRSILLDKDNNVIAGNGVVETSRKLGTKSVRIIETDGNELIAVKRTDLALDSKEGRELALADNSVANVNLEWDTDELQKAADEWGIVPEEWGVELPDFGLPDEFGEEFSLPEGDHTDFRRYGFMLHDSQYERAVIALKMAKADEGFKAYCDAQQNTNENGNALSYIFQQWVEQKKSSSK